MEWRFRGACLDENPDLFFPNGTGKTGLQVEAAKLVCRRCAVQVECLTFALDTGQESGVWGGMSETERRAHRRALLARGA